jgi:hypothetical protein
MALSMLGYRCFSDLNELPGCEFEKLFSGSADRVFDAYVNIGSLTGKMRELRQLYPRAKFITTTGEDGAVNGISLDGIGDIDGSDAVLRSDETNKWRVLCEHLKCAPPVCSFPKIADLGQRRVLGSKPESSQAAARKTPKRDRSPWVVESRRIWEGIHSVPAIRAQPAIGIHVAINDCLEALDPRRWLLRDDTFASNLALFRPRTSSSVSGVELH